MPAVQFNLFDQFRLNNFNGGGVDFILPVTGALNMAVMSALYVPDQNTDTDWTAISANEVTGTGYTLGGNPCDNGTATVDAGGVVTVDAADPDTWAQDPAGFSNGRSCVLYEVGSGQLIGYSNDFGADQGNLNGDFFIAFGVAGIMVSQR